MKAIPFKFHTKCEHIYKKVEGFFVFLKKLKYECQYSNKGSFCSVLVVVAND